MMFINSIFLPKTIPDQTIPGGISNTSGNFSHLFSNVFHIVKDEQENSLPFQLTNLNPESNVNTQNELLNVSLLSDNKSILENTNISMIVSAFLSKLNPGDSTEELSDFELANVNENIPKYFSLSKNNFIKEIKNIIETLKSGGTKNLENVEISLIANGQSIKINPLTTNVVNLENWVNEQAQSNGDFEILVKSTQKQLVVEAKPVKNKISKTDKPVEIISISSNENIEDETKSIVNKNAVVSTPVIKNTIELESGSQPPMEGLKQTIASLNKLTSETDVPTLTNHINTPIIKQQNNLRNTEPELVQNSSPKMNLELNEKVKTNQTITGKVVSENISALQKDFKSSLIAETQNELNSKSDNGLVSKLNTSIKKENSLFDSNSLNQKKVSSEKSIETTNKVVSNETKVKQNILSSEEILDSTETVEQTTDKNISEISKSDKKLNIKTNQKFNSVLINKNTVQEKISLNDLIEKTNVKEIDVEVQKFTKTNISNTSKIQNEHQPSTVSIKDITPKLTNPIVNADVKKVFVNNQEVKQPIVKNTLGAENLKTGKNFNNIIDAGPSVIKSTVNPNVNNTVQVQNTHNFSGQNEVVETEKVVLPKTETTKTSVNIQQKIKENLVSEPVGKTNVELKNLAQIKTLQVDSIKQKTGTNVGETSKLSLTPETKTEQGPIEIKLNSQKPFIENEKVVLPKTETTKTSVNIQQTIKENLVSEPVVKIIVEQKDLEQIKTSSVNSHKQKTETNVGEISKQSFTPGTKTEQKPVEIKSNPRFADDETIEVRNTNQVKENLKEIISVKSNTSTNNNENKKIEFRSNNNSEKTSNDLKKQTVMEKLGTSLKEAPTDEVKHESETKNQYENKSIKVDLMQRRVYSQIPPIEILADQSEVKNIKNPVLNVDTDKAENIQLNDEPVKSASNVAESKPKNEKNVWVKVSVEKNDNEVVSEVKKSTQQHSKITIDANNDGMKKDSEQNNFTEKESHEYQKSKPQTVSFETAKITEQKPVVQNQNTTDQQNLVSNIKPEIKTEQNLFKSALHSEEPGFSSRAAEIVEKIKVISSGEMIREVYKVFESGEKQSIVLRLVPKELGSIKIVLDTIDNVLTAKVEVENESVGHIIRNNVDQLKQSLLQSGVHVNSISISYHSADQKQNGFNNQKRKNSSYMPNNDIEEVNETIITKKMGYNTYEFLA